KITSPTSGQFNLVIGSFFQLEHDIYRSFFKIGPHVRLYGLGIEIPDLGKFTDGPHQGRPVKFLSRKNPDLPHDDMVTGPLIAFYGYTVDGHLRPFKYPELDIYGVIMYIDLNRFYRKEKVTIILIKGTDIIPSLGIIIQSLVHFLFIVDLPFVY